MIAGLLRRHRRLRLASVLGAPVIWMLVIYIGSLAFMVVSAGFQIDGFTQEPTTELTGDNLDTAFTTGAYLKVVGQSLGVAVAVTVLCVLVAVPSAFYVAKVAKPRWRRALIVSMLLPLWAGYLVKG